MHLAHIYTLAGWPLIKMRIFCRLGMNLRLLQRLILLPVPPLLLAIPLRVTTFPVSAPLLQIAHFFNMINTSWLEIKYT